MCINTGCVSLILYCSIISSVQSAVLSPGRIIAITGVVDILYLRYLLFWNVILTWTGSVYQNLHLHSGFSIGYSKNGEKVKHIMIEQI